MFSVTQRVSNITQPFFGLIPVSSFSKVQIDDSFALDNDLTPFESSTQGMAVDYLTRYLSGFSKEKAFEISLLGAKIANDLTRAHQLLDQISGLDDVSIENACQLVQYDVAYRSPKNYNPAIEPIFEQNLITNIRTLVKRCIAFFDQYGPIKECGFTFEGGGYNDIVSSGDGDYLTQDTIWDLKVSLDSLNKKQTLQLAMYYVMGFHSENPLFQMIKKIGVYNPLLNVAYTLSVEGISNAIYAHICRKIIGYITDDDDALWKQSYGTNTTLRDEIRNEQLANIFMDTGFRPKNYEDGIYDISVNDYWSYYKCYSSYPKPKFCYVKSIKFLKKSGYFMFVAVSPKGKYSVLDGGKKKALLYPLEYYYQRLDEYAKNVLMVFSKYWNSLFAISKILKDLKFDGTVHGCIVDLDFFTHIYVNPYNGTIRPYYAESMYSNHFFKNVASLIATTNPILLPNYLECIEQKNADVKLLKADKATKHPLISIDSSIIKGFFAQNNALTDNAIITETIYDKSTDMYCISRHLIGLQPIYEYHVVSAWYDTLLPVSEEYQELCAPPSKKTYSILQQSAMMNCGMTATVIEDNGYGDISVQFEDGYIARHKTRTDFRNGKIQNPNIIKPLKASIVGQTNLMDCGMKATVIEDNGYKDISVQFEDGKIVQHKTRYNFQVGKIHNPNIRASIVGQTNTMRCGMVATVINDIGRNKIIVQFDDKTIVSSNKQAFFNGRIINPNLPCKKTSHKEIVNQKEKHTSIDCKNKGYIGASKKMECGLIATVIEATALSNIKVQFEDGAIVFTTSYRFRKGTVKHPED